MAEIPRKDRAALKSDIALSRDRMGRELAGLRYELDFPRKFKNSFRHSPAVWMSALGVLGVLMAVAPARKKKVYVKPKPLFRFGKKKKEDTGEGVEKAGLAVAAAKIAGDIAKPFLIKLIARKFGGFGGSPPKI
ncbi:MAG: hypothetical protein JO354_13520 [Verrucomicrobia bacterium]|nr:hypothetical protein [Verrucomicrobiota bacterium]